MDRDGISGYLIQFLERNRMGIGNNIYHFQENTESRILNISQGTRNVHIHLDIQGRIQEMGRETFYGHSFEYKFHQIRGSWFRRFGKIL
jgi:hypothetical protein